MDKEMQEWIVLLKNENTDMESKEQIEEQICSHIIKWVKEKESLYNFEEEREMYSDYAFWDRIEQRINNRTRNYLQISEIRHLTDKDRADVCSHVFEAVYLKKENRKYVMEQYAYTENLSDAAAQLLYISEDIIFNRYFSKRRFTATILEVTGVDEKITDLIWNLFQDNKEQIYDMIQARRISSLKNKLNVLENKIDKIQNEIEMLIIDEYGLDEE